MASESSTAPGMTTAAAAATEPTPSHAADVPVAGCEGVAANLFASIAHPVGEGGTWDQVKALAHYMAKTEVHTYAFSVAAQVILSLFPFIVLLLTLSQRVFHSTKMADVVGEMTRSSS